MPEKATAIKSVQGVSSVFCVSLHGCWGKQTGVHNLIQRAISSVSAGQRALVGETSRSTQRWMGAQSTEVLEPAVGQLGSKTMSSQQPCKNSNELHPSWSTARNKKHSHIQAWDQRYRGDGKSKQAVPKRGRTCSWTRQHGRDNTPTHGLHLAERADPVSA